MASVTALQFRWLACPELRFILCRMYIPRAAKWLFTVDDGWNLFLDKFGDSITPWTRLCVPCGTSEMGVRRYCCVSATAPPASSAGAASQKPAAHAASKPLSRGSFRPATRTMLRWARKQDVEVGIFCALHTYGR